MAIDPIFLELPETPTFNVWRIEGFRVVPWTDFGAFYSGDSYIVLSAVFAGSSQRVVRDIYFWIGAQSSQDEYGSAAIKTVELDDRFGGEPTQHREVQYHESDRFIKLFEKYGGLRYLEGGVASGFRQVTTQESVQLYKIKGHRNPVLVQVKPVGTSLNQGDVFILTSRKGLYVWNGKSANSKEKAKAGPVLDLLELNFKGVPQYRLDGGETTPEFWELLGGETPIAGADEGGADAEAEAENVLRIYKVEGEDFALVAEGGAAVPALLTDGIFILQRGETVIVWLSKNNFGQKKNVFQIGESFLKKQSLPYYYSIALAREKIVSDELTVIFA